jgi:type II pantothenate kinase
MFGVDLGGSLTKIVYLGENGNIKADLIPSQFEKVEEYFRKESGAGLRALVPDPIQKWTIVGAGSYKYARFFEGLDPKPSRGDEMIANCLAVKYLLKRPDQISIFGGTGTIGKKYIIASMGTGVSFTVNSDDAPTRHVGGSALGGGTLMALSRLLLGITDFQELCSLAETGNSANLDLLICDMFGEDYGTTLTADVVGSSMAKAVWMEERPPDKHIAASLLATVSFAIGAHVAAICGAEKADSIVFVGGFLDIDGTVCKSLVKAVNLFHPEVTVVVPKNHHFIGALGAALIASGSQV